MDSVISYMRKYRKAPHAFWKNEDQQWFTRFADGSKNKIYSGANDNPAKLFFGINTLWRTWCGKQIK